jgi:hypothetical protein
MARSDRAKQLEQQLISQGKILPPRRQGAARNAYIDFDVTGRADLGEEGGPLSPGNGLPIGGLIEGGDGYGLYGGTVYQKQKELEKDPVDPIRRKKKTKKIVKEKVVSRKVVKIQKEDRDYVARIDEVLDANRIRVSLSYEDGVNKAKHKGQDQRAEKFTYWRVNYDKSNVNRYKTYMVKGNQHYLVVNHKLGADNLSRKVKLKQPLENTKKLDRVYFVEKRLPDYKDKIKLVPFVDRPDDGIFLRIPNLNSVDNPINYEGTQFQNHNDLLGSNTLLNFDLEEKLISGSLLNVQPTVDYQKTTTDVNIEADDFGLGNFVNFGSAEFRVKNFKKKLELIEGYNSSSSSLLSISSSAARISHIEKQRQRVVNSFDPFEHYMYFESSSYSSGSNGLFHDTAWPKMTSTTPYKLEHTSGSTATTWYDNRIASSSAYDFNNPNSLRNSLPEHIYADTQNNVFLEFMDMVGQQFDEIWVYVKHLTDVNKRVENLSEGISKDVAKEFAKSLGLQLFSGNDLVNLPEYLLGKNPDGSTKYESSKEQLTEEIWKRILANLPFFIKAKGTERAVKGLLSCYGIPSSMLRVREFGGPDKGTRVSYEIKRKFTRALDFKAGQYIKAIWKDAASTTRRPETIEFRFRSPHSVGTSGSMAILQKGNEWGISLQDNGSTDNLGHLKFAISGSSGKGTQFITSSLLPFYNDDFWSVMLTRKAAANRTDGVAAGGQLPNDTIHSQSIYELTTKQYDSSRQKILYSSTQNLTSHTSSKSTDVNNITGSQLNAAFTSSGHVFLGGSGSAFGTQFSGSLMEFRLWSEPLSSSVFDNHVRTPKAYNGNKSGSSYDNLLFRLPLDDNKNFQTNPTASEISYLETYQGIISGSNINGFTGNFFKTVNDQEKMRVPNVGPSRRNATKIRIEDNTLKAGTALSPEVRNEVSSQDFAPIDSNRLGIYFSPVDIVNEDIVYSIADLSFDDLIGDPRDEFKQSYRTLNKLQRDYFKRYNRSNNFWDYLRILSFYDSSVFTQTRQLLPARANSTLGVLIEPNILERRKEIIGKKPSFTNRYFENAQPFDDGILVTKINIDNPDSRFTMTGSSYDTYEGTFNVAFESGSNIGFLGMPTLTSQILGQNDRTKGFGTTYLRASSSVPMNLNLTDFIVPIISGSRISEQNQVTKLFFNSVSNANKARESGNPIFYANSSSFEPTDLESIAVSTQLFRSFYIGTKLTKSNSFDGKDPIEVTIVAPTRVMTQDSDLSKLRTE